MRFLAIDPGDKRTGLAVGDDEVEIVTPVGVIEPSDPENLLRGVREAIEEHGPDALVIGLPLHMDGSPSPGSRKAEALALLLEQHTALPVHRVDERLTSFDADQLMNQTGLTHAQKRARRDALAACAILRDFLARRRNP